MKKVHTSTRLKQIMDERRLKQVDILRLTKPICEEYGIRLGKNDLSQYISGKTEPGQHKLFVLAKALNINPVWLMGLDVSMEFEDTHENSKTTSINFPKNRIKELREASQLSMSDVAKKLGIPYTTYVNYEKCTREPNSEMLIAIADFFEVSIDYLLCRSNNKEKILIPRYLDSLSPDTAQLIDNYNKLNTSGKEKASDYVEDLTTIDKYTAAAEIQSKLG